jgi:hypothetical protein
MAYEYDRLEREEGGGSFLMGLLAGTVLGAGLGMLFAPKVGSDLRNQLTEQAGRLRHTAGDTYGQASEKVSQMMDRGREAYERARTGGAGAAGEGDTGRTGTGSNVGSQGGSFGNTGSSADNTGSMSGAGSYSTNRTS